MSRGIVRIFLYDVPSVLQIELDLVKDLFKFPTWTVLIREKH
jgi:hypothetical protein